MAKIKAFIVVVSVVILLVSITQLLYSLSFPLNLCELDSRVRGV